MSRVIFLSDNTSFGRVGAQRYIGPYSVAYSLENAGYDTIVIDYFNRIKDFFIYFESLLTNDTLFVGISSTFISPAYNNKLWLSASSLTHSTESYSSSPLMFKDSVDLQKWLIQLRECINRVCPKAKIIVGGAKVQFLLSYSQSHLNNIDYFLWGSADGIMTDIASDLKVEKKNSLH